MFCAIEVFALALWVHVSRNAWFDLDEWDFLVERKAGDVGDLFRAHNGHWTTLPILAYRLLFWTFGLRTYLPYRVLAIVVYLVSAALLMVVVRRAGVNPWIATATAGLYALFGFGWANILRGFQVTLTGSLVFGLAHLLLTDHEGPVDRRDLAGLVAGFIGLLCSGLAVVMVMIVGVVALWKRGWRVALLHTAPFFACYAAWALVIGGRNGGGVQRVDPVTIGRVTWYGWGAALDAMAPVRYLGLALALALVAGFVLATRRRYTSGTLAQLATPVVMFAAAGVFLAMSAAFNRREILNEHEFAAQERYLSVTAALMIPALAVAADALARRWRWLVAVMVIFFLAAIPRNIDRAVALENSYDFTYAATRNMVITLPTSALLADAPSTLEPERLRSWRITAGWIRDSVARGRIPVKRNVNPLWIYAADFRLSFDLVRRAAPTKNCTRLREPLQYVPRKGDVIGLYNNAVAIQPKGFVPLYPPVVFAPEPGTAIVVLHDLGASSISWLQGGFFPNIDSFRGFPRVCIETAAAQSPGVPRP